MHGANFSIKSKCARNTCMSCSEIAEFCKSLVARYQQLSIITIVGISAADTSKTVLHASTRLHIQSGICNVVGSVTCSGCAKGEPSGNKVRGTTRTPDFCASACNNSDLPAFDPPSNAITKGRRTD